MIPLFNIEGPLSNRILIGAILLWLEQDVIVIIYVTKMYVQLVELSINNTRKRRINRCFKYSTSPSHYAQIECERKEVKKSPFQFLLITTSSDV